MKSDIIQQIQHAKNLDNHWEKVNYLKNFKKELIKYAVKEPFIVEEELKNIPSEIRDMVWKGYQKSLKKTLKTGFGITSKKKSPNPSRPVRRNLLHELIDKTDIRLTNELRRKPEQLAVFHYLRKNHEKLNLDEDGIIDEIKDLVIYWTSHKGKTEQMIYTTFCKTLSNLRKKRKLPLPE